MKFDMVLEQFKLNIPIVRETTAVLLTALKNFNVGMHSDVYESIWLKLGMEIYTVQLNILIVG